MMKHSTPVILTKKDDEIGPQKKSVVSLQADTAQATDAGQNKETPASTAVIIVAIVFVVGIICAFIYAYWKHKGKGIKGGGTVPNTVTASPPSIIDEEVSSILTGLSQL